MPTNDLHYFHPDWITPDSRKLTVDACIYGATSAGVIAAIELAERGKSVALLQPGKFIGGVTTGGLGETDAGKKSVIGGKSMEFYRRVGKHYGQDEQWKFEPHIAAAVYDQWLREANIEPILCQYLDRVEVTDRRITKITLLGGLQVTARVFLDCTYEGDLMAKAGVPFHAGREDNAVFGETLNGAQVGPSHQFSPSHVDPFIIAGDASSGLLPQVERVNQLEHIGRGDRRVQAYCFRICMTSDPELMIPWQKPDGFDPRQYIIASRWFLQDEKDEGNEHYYDRPGKIPDRIVRKFDCFPKKTAGGFEKTDTNNSGPVSSDFIGANWAWPEGSYQQREAIFQKHVAYQQGFYWFMANSPEVPDRYRRLYRQWGLCKDEFTTTGGWSHTLYVREGRRMMSDYVLTQKDAYWQVKCDDPVGMGSYQLDSHNCTRFVNAEGKVMNEGDVQKPPTGPYGVSFRSIVPPKKSITNLVVPVALSASHIAYGSVRMEPVFMGLGQSAAIIASQAIDAACAVQDLPYPKLRQALEDAHQICQL